MAMINVMRRLIILSTIFFISITTSAEYALVADYVIDGKSDDPLKKQSNFGIWQKDRINY